MLNAVSDPNHTFTGQARSSKRLFASIMCSLSPTMTALTYINYCRLLCLLPVTLKVISANSVDPDQTAPFGAV